MPVIVNGHKISDEELRAETQRCQQEPPAQQQVEIPGAPAAKSPEERAKERLVNRKLLEQAIKKLKLAPSEEQLDKGQEELFAEHGGKEAFLGRFHLTEDDLPRIRDHVKQNVQMEMLIDRQCDKVDPPTETELRTFYGQHLPNFVEPLQIRVSHIVKRPDQGGDGEAVYEEMCGIRKKLQDGADFGELADERSDCSQEPQGDLGFFAKGQMVEGFEAVAFSMDVGEISPVFLTQFGFHIAQVTDRREPRQQTFEECSKDIEQRLVNEREQRVLNSYIDGLRSQATIVELAEGEEPASKKKTKKKKRR